MKGALIWVQGLGFRGVRGGGLGFLSLEQPCGCEVPSKRRSGLWSKGTEGVISKPNVLMGGCQN